MIDEDRTTWTLGQLADEVIEACELPMGCRGTIIAALDDAKLQGRTVRENELAALRERARLALEAYNAHDGMLLSQRMRALETLTKGHSES